MAEGDMGNEDIDGEATDGKMGSFSKLQPMQDAPQAVDHSSMW
jgi:hypothetical protein